ncbi:MAG: SAM-dependent methyltransferase, partial [Polyangiaceae bacterium]|nr:SAM-dependent methyltransferase [Polyangiaceae bacterium]
FADPVAASLLSPGWAIAMRKISRALDRAPPARRDRAIAHLDAISLRVAAIDAELERAVHDGCRQLVILGAGLDTRAFRLRALADVDVYEVDHPATQEYKRRRSLPLRAVSKSLSFVPVDFERASLGGPLSAAGHRANERTVWVWEGVVMYLTDGALRSALGDIRRASSAGSTLILHYHEPPRGFRPEQLVRFLLLSFWWERQIGQRSAARMREEVQAARFEVASDTGMDDWTRARSMTPPRGETVRVARLLVARPSPADAKGKVAMSTDADQIAIWNGPVGERWAREQESADRAFAAFAAELLSRAELKPGQRVLDIGCGNGTTTLAAADAVGPGGAVFGVDVSSPMLARARARSLGRPNVDYALGSAATQDFGRAFDVAISRFGVMFFADPVAAFAHLRGALRPGGALVFTCWRAPAENAWARCPHEAAAPHLPPAAPQDPLAPGPFAFADAGRVTRILRDAGFGAIDVAPFDAEVVLSNAGLDDAVRFAVSFGPTAGALREADESTAARAREAIAARFEPLLRGPRLVLGGAVWVVRAIVP